MEVTISHTVEELMTHPERQEVMSVRVHLPNGQHADVTVKNGVIQVHGSATVVMYPKATNAVDIDIIRHA